MGEQNPSRLLSLADLDPERTKPMVYAVTIDIPVGANQIGQGVIQLNHQPIFITRAALTMLGNTDDPETSGLYNDGQVLVSMRDEMRTYQNVPVQADLLWGPKTQGPWRTLEYPIYYKGGHAIHFELINVYTRILTPPALTFRCQIALAGLADWGAINTNIA